MCDGGELKIWGMVHICVSFTGCCRLVGKRHQSTANQASGRNIHLLFFTEASHFSGLHLHNMQKIQGWSPIGDARQTKQNKNKFAKLNFITVTHDSDLEENV